MKTVKVRYNGCTEAQANWGHGVDPRPLLTEGLVYTLIREPEVHSWHTLYWLKGYVGPFNSVCFEEVNNGV